MSLQTPIVFLIFNRPHLTAQVFETIRAARPTRLLVVADGPRRPDEVDLCNASQKIASAIDWPCDLTLDFSARNLGCRARVSLGLDHAFSIYESAIVLEDDCVPDPSFFPFCQQLLERYEHDPRVGFISGDNFQFDTFPVPESYYFSIMPHVWGWASWRRVWKNYRVDACDWRALSSTDWLESHLSDRRLAKQYRDALGRIVDGTLDTWDVQLGLTLWRANQLCVIPKANLVTNIGFGPDATHTRRPGIASDIATTSMNWPLVHPSKVEQNKEADRNSLSKLLDSKNL